MTFQGYVERLARRSPRTAVAWRSVLVKWASELGYDSPDEVIAEIKSKGSDSTLRAIEILDRSVAGFVERELASKTVNNYYYAIKGFLENEDLELPPWKLKKITKPRSCVESYDRAPSLEEMRRILSHATGARSKAAILLLATSGMRLDELCHLKVGNFDFNSKPTKITIGGEEAKTRQRRITFITDEATAALKDYLGTRLGNSDSSVLMARGGRALHKDTLYRQIMTTVEKAGLKGKIVSTSYTYQIHPHCFRKFFKTRLVQAEMPDTFVEALLGHLNQNDRSYFRATEEELADAYAKYAEAALTIFSVEPKGFRESVEWFKMKDQERDSELAKIREENKRLRASSQDSSVRIKRIEEEIDKALRVLKEIQAEM